MTWVYQCRDCDAWFNTAEKKHDPYEPGDTIVCESCGEDSAVCMDWRP